MLVKLGPASNKAEAEAQTVTREAACMHTDQDIRQYIGEGLRVVGLDPFASRVQLYALNALHSSDTLTAIKLSCYLFQVTLPYCMSTGCTGTPARNAPLLNGSRYLPLVVVPCWKEQNLL